METLELTIGDETYKIANPDDKWNTVLKYSRFHLKFTANDGVERKLKRLGFYDPRLHEELGWTTREDAIVWWIENRESIKRHATNNDVWEEVCYYFARYNYGISYQNFKICSYSEIRGILGRDRFAEPSVVFAETNSNRDSGRFRLYEPETTQVEQNLIYNIYDFSNNTIYLTPVDNVSETSSGLDRRWYSTQSYSYRMDDSSHDFFRSVSGEQHCFFGLELEVSTKLSNQEIQTIVTEMEPKQKPFFIFKGDSSISGCYDNYVEIVTVPCSPRYLRKNFKILFQKLEKLCEKKGHDISDYFDTSRSLSNGIHIHVGRDDFCRKPHMNRYVAAWNQWDTKSVKLLNTVSQRPSDYQTHGYCRVSSRYTATKPKTKYNFKHMMRRASQRSIAERLKGINDDNRTNVCNTTNRHTIETRLYQGIFDLDHLMRCISFNEAMFEFTEVASYTMFDENFVPEFSKFIKGKTKYRSLTKLIEEVEAQCA